MEIGEGGGLIKLSKKAGWLSFHHSVFVWFKCISNAACSLIGLVVLIRGGVWAGGGGGGEGRLHEFLAQK